MPVSGPPVARPALDRSALERLPSPWHVEVLAESPSTNAVVATRARAGEPEGLVLVAEHQTAGRGRLDRVWVTPPRSALTLSVLLTPAAVPPARWPWLPLLTGVAVATAVRRVAGVHARLKWPNDVLVEERKLAGILVELVEGPSGPAAVVGVGLNVSTRADELPVPTATSLAAVGVDVDRSVLLAEVLRELGSTYDAWRAVSGDASKGLSATYTELSATVGETVRVELPGGEQVTGKVRRIDAGGRLVVGSGPGTRTLGAGDVVHLRVT